MAHSKKTTKRKTKQKPEKAASSQNLQIQTTEERSHSIKMKNWVREDLLDRL